MSQEGHEIEDYIDYQSKIWDNGAEGRSYMTRIGGAMAFIYTGMFALIEDYDLQKTLSRGYTELIIPAYAQTSREFNELLKLNGRCKIEFQKVGAWFVASQLRDQDILPSQNDSELNKDPTEMINIGGNYYSVPVTFE